MPARSSTSRLPSFTVRDRKGNILLAGVGTEAVVTESTDGSYDFTITADHISQQTRVVNVNPALMKQFENWTRFDYTPLEIQLMEAALKDRIQTQDPNRVKTQYFDLGSEW